MVEVPEKTSSRCTPPNVKSATISRKLARKLYCYVDETGQHTKGDFFLVAVVTVGENRDALRAGLEEIERRTRKGERKWSKARPEYRLAYIQEVFRLASVPLRFAQFSDDVDYERMTAVALSRELRRDEHANSRATVLVDGLQKSRIAKLRKALRQAGANVRKVRGLSDESDALVRLADAFAGFARLAVYNRDPEARRLFRRARSLGLIEELGGP